MNHGDRSKLLDRMEQDTLINLYQSTISSSVVPDALQEPLRLPSTHDMVNDSKTPIEMGKKASPNKLSKAAASAGKPVATRKKKTSGRPLTGYNLFFQKQRENVSKLRREQLSTKPGCQASHAKLISIKWKELSPSERAHYDALAAEEKLRQYSRKQGWVQYCTEDHPQNGPPMQGRFVDNQGNAELDPWPIESIRAIAQELDDESIDILIRALA